MKVGGFSIGKKSGGGGGGAPAKVFRLDAGDEDDDRGGRQTGRQVFEGFENGKVIGAGGDDTPAPLIVPPRPNRDWKALKRRRMGYVPPEQQQQKAIGAPDQINNTVQAYGLQVREKREVLDEQEATITTTTTVEKEEKGVVLSEEDAAIKAILQGGEQQPDLMIPMANKMTETEALRQDVLELPDMASLEAYDAMPVEAFGAALLRGMGWKEGDAIGMAAKPSTVERRPALLGLGAKERPAAEEEEELGAWGKGSLSSKKKKQKQNDRVYVPVVKRNKRTGEVILVGNDEQRKDPRQVREIS